MVRTASAAMFLVALSVAVAIHQNSILVATLAIGLALATFEVLALARMAGGFTAALLPVFTVNGVFLTAPVLWGKVQAVANVSIEVGTSDELHIKAAIIGIAFSAAYTAGALLGAPRGPGLSIAQFALVKGTRAPKGPLVAIGYAGICLSIYSLQGALLQGRYLEARGPFWAVAVSTVVIPLAILAFAIVAAQRGPWRGLALTGICIFALILFGKASRMIALLPILIIFARAHITGGQVRARSIAVAGALTVVLLQLPLIGRSNPDGVGIVPLGKQLLNSPGDLLSDFSLAALLGNLLVSGPLTAAVAGRPIRPETLWISVNPMPGDLAGWSEIRQSLKLNAYTPYNSLGELAAHGWVALASVAFATGFLLAISTRLASKLRGGYQTAAAMLVLAGASLFSLAILQYNLRSSARLLWYVVFGLIAIWIASIALQRRHRRVAKSSEHRSRADRSRILAGPAGKIFGEARLLGLDGVEADSGPKASGCNRAWVAGRG